MFVGHKLFIVDPSTVKLKTLAFCRSLYHACVNDTVYMRRDGYPGIVQSRDSEVARHCAHLVGGR